MFRQERLTDYTVALRAAFDGFRTELWTAMPGIVVSYDPASQTAKVDVALRIPVFNRITGEWVPTKIETLGDVVVQMPRGGGFALTVPIAADDEGLLVFASRCIDRWWYYGGISDLGDIRYHDLSDAFFIPGVNSKPRAITPAPSSTAAELRSLDGTAKASVSATGVSLNFGANSVTVNAAGVAIVGTAVTINGAPYALHTHTTSGPVSGNTGPVNPTP